MNDATRERLVDAVLESIDQGTPLDLTVAGGDRAALAELRACADTAAAVTAALCADVGPMPAALARRLTDLGRRIAQERTAPPAAAGAAPPRTAVPQPARRANPWLVFAFGAAAGLAAASVWLHTPPAGAPVPSRAELLARRDAAHVEWQQGPSHAFGEVHGDVVWSAGIQQGYLRIDGLQPLPEDLQYQLWIVDGSREGAPVDGGLFDLRGTGEHVVPIQARLPVADAKAFVVTVEKRGGVVVSAQENVVAIASL
ncbi:MAG: anti-sigma factor [Planctomycetota bacterium]